MGYLRFVDEEDATGIRGALFLTTGRGDPLEFGFTRVDVHDSILRRQGDGRRQAVSLLVKALFEATKLGPVLILGIAEEIPPEVFTEDIWAETSLCLFAHSMEPSDEGGAAPKAIPAGQPEAWTWATEQPPEDSEPIRVFQTLIGRQNPLEPFERASLGLIEAYGAG